MRKEEENSTEIDPADSEVGADAKAESGRRKNIINEVGTGNNLDITVVRYCSIFH